MLESPREFEMLRKGYVSLVPIAWRSESDLEGFGYFTDTRYVANQEKTYPIENTRDKYRFKLLVKSGSFANSSPQFYLIRCPSTPSNGHFVLEIEYEGEGTRGI
jgi:hypothetical protein